MTVTSENGQDRIRDLKAQDRDKEKEQEEKRKNPPFVQLTKRKMPELREHLRANPLAIDIFLFIAQHMGTENILICSLSVLMEETGKSKATIGRAVKYLKDQGLVYAVKFGSCSGYALDGEYVWTTFHHPGRYAVFQNAKALASRSENKIIAKKLSTVFHNQPPLPGLELSKDGQ
jgi:DNA-binding transcriptional ArsR family regulator